MRHYLLAGIFLLITTFLDAQTVTFNFNKEKDTVQKKEKDVILPIDIIGSPVKIKDSAALYSLFVKVNTQKTSLPVSAYELNFVSVPLDRFNLSHRFFLTIKGDSLPDRERHIYLDLQILKNGKVQDSANTATNNLTMDITVEEGKALNSYNYLGYIGTNFDLVDGVQAKNLFFATNIFSPPQQQKDGFGFNILLYGNRTLTQTDTSGAVTYTSRIVGIGGDSARSYIEQGLKTVTRVSDNLGAAFTPLFRIGKHASDPSRVTQLYYAPQFEFIWRRTKITTTYAEGVLVDSIDRPNRPISGTLILTPPNETTALNVYDVYLGLLGFLMKHENSRISVRVQTAVGVNYSYTAINSAVKSVLYTPYDRRWDLFFAARAWITEPSSGLTFGAEVSNTFGRGNYKPFYNVTLSKAINLSAIGAIFTPVTSR